MIVVEAVAVAVVVSLVAAVPGSMSVLMSWCHLRTLLLVHVLLVPSYKDSLLLSRL